MRRIRLTFFIPLIAFLGLALISALALQGTLTGNRNPSQLPSVLIGKSAPSISLSTLQDNGAQLSLNPYYGEPFLVNFFASWCSPCRAEAPALQQLSEQIEIIGIAYKDRSEDTLRFLQQYGDPFVAIGKDDDGRTGISWGVYGVPETYLIDAAGIVKWRHAGPLTRDIITNNLLPQLNEITE